MNKDRKQHPLHGVRPHTINVHLHVLDDMRVDSALEAMTVTAILLCSRTVHTQCIFRGSAVRARALTHRVCLSERSLYSHVLRGQEDDLGVCGLGHGLHSFEVADLHSGCGGEYVCRLTVIVSVRVPQNKW
jgi:hypothetical protein